MIVSVSTDGVELLDADVFTSFHVTAPADVDVAAVLEDTRWGTSATDGDMWIEVEALTAGDRSPEWMSAFGAMMTYAESKGWTDDTGQRIRAHVVTTP